MEEHCAGVLILVGLSWLCSVCIPSYCPYVSPNNIWYKQRSSEHTIFTSMPSLISFGNFSVFRTASTYKTRSMFQGMDAPTPSATGWGPIATALHLAPSQLPHLKHSSIQHSNFPNKKDFPCRGVLAHFSLLVTYSSYILEFLFHSNLDLTTQVPPTFISNLHLYPCVYH